jgi:outer membrane protein OmpA-like peptidoglycan-associated protein
VTANFAQLRKDEMIKRSTLVAVILMISALPLLAQTNTPKVQIFGGYSYLSVDSSPDRESLNGWNLQPSINLNRWFSFTFDGGGYYGSPHGVTFHDYTFMGGPTLTLRKEHVAPFVHALFGADHLGASVHNEGSVSDTSFALAVGGGLDFPIKEHFGIRLAQVDWLRTTHFSEDQNNIRLSTGLLLMFGGAPPVPVSASCSASPSEVTEGEPVTVTATGANFNPKHTVTYGWTTNGGKLDTGNAQSAHIDTTGVAAGSYAANGTVTDAKMKKNGTATCSANYTVKAKPMNPPQVSCSANPSTVQGGSPSTITASATSPDNSQITGYSYSASAGQISGTGTTATLDTAGVQGGPVTVTVTATDARNLTGNGTCTVSVEVPPPPPGCSKLNTINFPDQKRPWRVDNTAKAILDDVATRLKSDPNAKVVIVGYADGEKAPMVGTGKKRHQMDLAAQRAVNAKAYLVQQQGIDPSRVDVKTGTGQSGVANIIWVPQGADMSNAQTCADLQSTTAVDESAVTPSENAYPKPAAPMRHHGKKGAAADEAAPAEQPAAPQQ